MLDGDVRAVAGRAERRPVSAISERLASFEAQCCRTQDVVSRAGADRGGIIELRRPPLGG